MFEPLVDALNRLAVDRQATEDLPRLATDALVAGVDSPALRQLAGLRADDYQDARDRFVDAMYELGHEMPSPEAARWALARSWAREMVRGVLSPYEASRRIWWEGWNELGRPDALTVFVGLASQWEDDEVHRSGYEIEMLAAARELLDSEP